MLLLKQANMNVFSSTYIRSELKQRHNKENFLGWLWRQKTHVLFFLATVFLRMWGETIYRNLVWLGSFCETAFYVAFSFFEGFKEQVNRILFSFFFRENLMFDKVTSEGKAKLCSRIVFSSFFLRFLSHHFSLVLFFWGHPHHAHSNPSSTNFFRIFSVNNNLSLTNIS